MNEQKQKKTPLILFGQTFGVRALSGVLLSVIAAFLGEGTCKYIKGTQP